MNASANASGGPCGSGRAVLSDRGLLAVVEHRACRPLLSWVMGCLLFAVTNGRRAGTASRTSVLSRAESWFARRAALLAGPATQKARGVVQFVPTPWLCDRFLPS